METTDRTLPEGTVRVRIDKATGAVDIQVGGNPEDGLNDKMREVLQGLSVILEGEYGNLKRDISYNPEIAKRLTSNLYRHRIIYHLFTGKLMPESPNEPPVKIRNFTQFRDLLDGVHITQSSGDEMDQFIADVIHFAKLEGIDSETVYFALHTAIVHIRAELRKERDAESRPRFSIKKVDAPQNPDPRPLRIKKIESMPKVAAPNLKNRGEAIREALRKIGVQPLDEITIDDSNMEEARLAYERIFEPNIFRMVHGYQETPRAHALAWAYFMKLAREKKHYS
ncbi:MAG: hypothetical protein US89_C0006G0082 [Candidatus Peregrinibacteria bacterium GW2011_GWF2_38_29]|nr:MAG: hypothetical protein US89_C0006G0082 [Candidatus Peregrinibacteria bacterium GW2011_GWF2_38_29]HBB03273.1 hypothetical protein [Candidatus Peregrinibacteria bacterium]